MKQEEVLPSFLSQPFTQHRAEKKIIKPKPKAIALKKDESKPIKTITSTKAATPALKPQPRLTGNNKPVAELLAKLHAAIAAHQRYPTSALAMGREGRATLTFMLYPNGTISHLRISNSSQTSSLDAAALAAIQESLPFQKVSDYIHSPHEYQIDVVFELT